MSALAHETPHASEPATSEPASAPAADGPGAGIAHEGPHGGAADVGYAAHYAGDHAPTGVKIEPSVVSATMKSAEQAAERIAASVGDFGQAALNLDAGAVAGIGMAIQAAWSLFDAMSSLAQKQSADLFTGVKPEEMATRMAVLRETMGLPQLRVTTIAQLGKVGPCAANVGPGAYAKPVGNDVAGFLVERTAHTLGLVNRASAVLEEAGPMGSFAALNLLNDLNDFADFELINAALRRRGVVIPDSDETKDHRKELKDDDRMKGMAKQDLSPQQLTLLKMKAQAITGAKGNFELAKSLLKDCTAAERSALITQVDFASDDGMNWLLSSDDPELLELIHGTTYGKGAQYDQQLESAIARSRAGAWDAVTSGEFWKDTAELLPGRILKTGEGFVKAAGDVPLVGRVISHATDPLAELMDKGVDGLDGLTGADEIWKMNPDAKKYSDGIAMTTGAVEFQLALAKGAGSVTGINQGVAAFGGTAYKAAQVGASAYDFVVGLDNLAEGYEKSKNLINLIETAVFKIPTAIIEAEHEDQSVLVATLSAILDSAIGTCADAAGEMTAGEGEKRDQEHLERNLRRADIAQARAGGEVEKPESVKEAYEHAGYDEGGTRHAQVNGHQIDTEGHTLNDKGEALDASGKKIDVSKVAGFAEALITQLAKALKEALIAFKDALLAPLRGGKEPVSVRKALLKGAANAAVNIMGNLVEAAADPLGDVIAEKIFMPFVEREVERLAIPVPPFLFKAPIAHAIKAGAVNLFELFKDGIKDKLLSAFGVGEEGGKKEEGKEEPKETAANENVYSMYAA